MIHLMCYDICANPGWSDSNNNNVHNGRSAEKWRKPNGTRWFIRARSGSSGFAIVHLIMSCNLIKARFWVPSSHWFWADTPFFYYCILSMCGQCISISRIYSWSSELTRPQLFPCHHYHMFKFNYTVGRDQEKVINHSCSESYPTM